MFNGILFFGLIFITLFLVEPLFLQFLSLGDLLHYGLKKSRRQEILDEIKIVGYKFVAAWIHIDCESEFNDKKEKEIHENINNSDLVNAAVIYFPSHNPETAELKTIIEKVQKNIPKRGYEFGINFLPNTCTLKDLKDEKSGEKFKKALEFRKKFFSEFDENLIICSDPYPIYRHDVFMKDDGKKMSTEEVLQTFYEKVRGTLKARMKLIKLYKIFKSSPTSPKLDFDPALKPVPVLSPPQKRKFDQMDQDQDQEQGQGQNQNQNAPQPQGPSTSSNSSALLAIAASLATAQTNQGSVNNLAEALMAHIEQEKDQNNQQQQFLQAHLQQGQNAYQQQQKLLEDNVNYLATITTHMGQTVDKVQTINTQGAVVNLIDQRSQTHHLKQVQNNLHQNVVPPSNRELKNLDINMLNSGFVKEGMSRSGSGRLRSGQSGSQGTGPGSGSGMITDTH